VELPARAELFVDVKAARALGLTVPPGVLRRAERAID